jgi:hypothetical protein
MLLANGGALLASSWILRRIGTGRAAPDLVLLLTLRYTLIAVSVLVAGLGGFLTPAGLGFPLALAFVVLLALGEHRRLPVRRIPRLGPLLAGGFAFVVARMLLQVWCFAPYVGDALSYHLPKVAEWVQQGRISSVTGADLRSTFPAGFELLEIWWTVFLHHDVLIEMAGVEFWLLGAAAVHALARWTGLSARSSAFAALIYGLTPTFAFQATACLNDGAVAALVLSTCVLIAFRLSPFLWVWIAALGTGVKPTYLFALPGFAVLAWLCRSAPSLPGPRRILLAVAAAGLAVGGFWYARNLALHGNPLYPMASADGRHLNQQVGPRLGSLLENLRRIADDHLLDSQAPYGPMTKYASGWGPVPFAAGLLAALWVVRFDRGTRILALSIIVSTLCILALVVPDSWFMRFILFFPALTAVALARFSASFRPAWWVAGFALALQFLGTFVPDDFGIDQVSEIVREPWRERGLGPLVPGEPDDARVACLVPGGRKEYLLYRPDFSRRVEYLREHDLGRIESAMESQGLRVLYAPSNHPAIIQAMQERRLKSLTGRFFAKP